MINWINFIIAGNSVLLIKSIPVKFMPDEKPAVQAIPPGYIPAAPPVETPVQAAPAADAAKAGKS